MKRIIFIVMIACLVARAQQETPMEWTRFPDPAFQVYGLAFWQQNSPDLFRLPKSAQTIVRKPVWNLARSTSGARIRFKSDCTQLAVRLVYPPMGGMRNMHKFGQCGVDLYVGNDYAGTAIPTDSTYVEHNYFRDVPGQMREYTLYLPLYIGVQVLAIGTNPGAVFEPADPYVLDKPVVYYGSSITQGGCASHPGMSYQAIVSRHLNLDFVNLGFSGNGLGEPEMATIIASIDAACYVLDYGVNLPSADSVASVYGPFLRIIRERRPDTPIICVTPIYMVGEYWKPNRVPLMREVIRREVARARAEGDKNIMLVEGFELLGPELADGLVDGVHPNDLGFQAMAEGLQPYLSQLLLVSGRGYLLRK